MNPIVLTLIKGMLYYILKAKQGGKYLDRKKVVDRKTGKMRYKYKYKPMQQRAAHEVTRNKFEKVTKLSGDEHKNQIEHALQNGIHVSLHVLRDYPDLITKYHQQARLAKADKIRAKVKAHKEKERMEREVRLNTPEGLKNNPIKLEAERMMKEDGLIKDVPVSDNSNSLKKLASEYVDMKESSQVSNPSTENKGSEEKKMETVKWQDVIKLKGSDKQIKYAKDLLATKNNEQYSTKFYILSKLIQKSATTNPDKEFNASEIISLMKDYWSKAHTKKVGELLGHEISNVPPNDNYNPLDDYIVTKLLGATWDENRGFYIKDGNTVNVPDWILGSKLEYPDHIAGQKDKENAAIIKEWLKN